MHFPPGLKDFDFPSWIPALQGTFWEPTVTKITALVWLSVAILIVFFLVAYRKPKLVPTRTQFLAESLYSFVRDSVAVDIMGKKRGIQFAPYLATLFCFIVLNNIFGIIPLVQISPNSHIAFPAILAIISYVLFIYVGIKEQGFGKYVRNSLFPPSAPWWLYPLLAPLEFASTFIFRPVTLAIRLFANMFGGHLLLLVFTLGGMALLTADNFAIQAISPLAFAMAILMTFFELLVQVLQAYVFIILTAVFIGEAAEEH